MFDDEVDEELLALLRKALGRNSLETPTVADTGVLEDAQFIYDNAIDVAIDSSATKVAAALIWEAMQEKGYSFKTWSSHELHPKGKTEATVDFIFTMDLLNFSFWSENSVREGSVVEYRGTKWTGYWSLVAALQRAIDEGV